MNSTFTRRILCPDAPDGMTNTGTRWTKKQPEKSDLHARAVEVQTPTTINSTEHGVAGNVNTPSSYKESIITNPGGRNYLRDNLR